MKNKSTGILLIAVALIGFGVWQVRGEVGGFMGGDDEQSLEGAEVQRGQLRISELVRGNLKAKDSISLKCEVEGRSTVLWLIDEGSLVEAGDLVAELDVSQLADNIVEQEIALQNANASYTKAKEQYEIQQIQNATDIARAELDLQFANIDQRKYLAKDGEYEHELAQAEEAIVLREESLSQAKTKYEWTQKLFDKGFAQRTELDADRFSVERATIEWEQSVREKSLLAEFNHDRRVAELQANVETMQRELEKTRKQAIAQLTDFEADRASTKAKLELEQIQFEKLKEQIGKSKLIAPEAGMVVYAREKSRYGGGEPMAEGKEVRERQVIVTIPRARGMIAEASLHETVLKKVQAGQECVITMEAIAGRVFRGSVDFVAVLPDSNGWMSDPNQRVYRAEIAISETIPDMRPGMSCSIEILASEIADTHYVPIQSVFLDGGKPIVFVAEGGEVKKTPIEIGLDNSKWVEVKSGVTEGQIVLLTAPMDFIPAKAEVQPIPESDGKARGNWSAGGGPADDGKVDPTGGNKGPGAGQRGAGKRPGGGEGMRRGGGGGHERGSRGGGGGGERKSGG